MKELKNAPVTSKDAELIFKLLEIITNEIHRLFEFGAVDESSDYEVDKLQAKIANKQNEIARLRQLVSKARLYISRRKEVERQRRKK